VRDNHQNGHIHENTQYAPISLSLIEWYLVQVGSNKHKLPILHRRRRKTMATLIECPTCKKQVSSEAATCPNCGHVLHRQNAPNSFNLTDPVHLIAVVLFLVIAAIVVFAVIGGK
jgi:uncharacterized paraquat-inducible protein A